MSKQRVTTGFFLIPTSYIDGGKLPIDYRAETARRDRRTRFFRNYAKWETSSGVVEFKAQAHDLRIFYDKDGGIIRVLAPNAKAARAFFRELQKYGFGEVAEK